MRRLVAKAVPRNQEARVVAAVHGTHLAARFRERLAADPLQDRGVAPLDVNGVRRERTAIQIAAGLEPLERLGDDVARQAVACDGIGGRERAARLREAAEQTDPRVGHGFAEGRRQALRERDARGTAVETRVLGGDQARLDADGNERGALLTDEHVNEPGDRRPGRTPFDLALAQIPDPEQRVVQSIESADPAGRRQGLQFRVHLGHDLRVEQVLKRGFAEESAQLRLVDS